MKLSFFKLGIITVFLVGPIGAARGCGVNWRIPTNHFDGVNEMGEFSYWQEIGQLDFGNDLKVPLIIGFRPTRGGISLLGRGWILPILESNIVQVDETRFLLTQPDGSTWQFWRLKPTDANLFGQGNWKGEIKEYTINLWAECGWKLVFYKGKLASITTPKNRILNVVYVNGRASEIQERGKTALKVESDQSGTVTGLRFGANYVPIEIGERPRVDAFQGVNVVAGTEKSLHILKLPGASQAVYEFGVDEKIQPTLNISGDTSRSFTWNPTTGRLLKDGKWSYDIKLGTERWPNAEVRRSNIEKKSEYWFDDTQNGREIVQGLDGIQRTTIFYTSGQLGGKIREIQEMANGVTHSVLKNNYDDAGRLIRSVDEWGVIQIPHYDNAGQIKYQSYDLDPSPENVAQRSAKETEYFQAISNAPNKYKKDDALRALAAFYIQTLHAPEKASELAKQISCTGERLSVLLIAIETNTTLGKNEKNEGYRKLLNEYPANSETVYAAIEALKKER